MEVLGYVLLFCLIVSLVVSPVYFSLFKYSFIKSLLASSLVCSLLVVCIYWGAGVFVDLRLSMMGYDLSEISDSARLEGVPIDRHEEANQLYQSTFGVGWPLSVILSLGIFVIPYILIVLTVVSFYKKFLRKKLT